MVDVDMTVRGAWYLFFHLVKGNLQFRAGLCVRKVGELIRRICFLFLPLFHSSRALVEILAVMLWPEHCGAVVGMEEWFQLRMGEEKSVEQLRTDTRVIEDEDPGLG